MHFGCPSVNGVDYDAGVSGHNSAIKWRYAAYSAVVAREVSWWTFSTTPRPRQEVGNFPKVLFVQQQKVPV
jgi:hypothetical protein